MGMSPPPPPNVGGGSHPSASASLKPVPMGGPPIYATETHPRPQREWDRGKTREGGFDDRGQGHIAPPSFHAARVVQSNLPSEKRNYQPCNASQNISATPADRRVEKWRRELEKDDKEDRERDERRFRDRETRWEREEGERERSRRKRIEREQHAARDRRRDLQEDLEPDEDERYVVEQMERSAGDQNKKSNISRNSVYEQLVSNGPPGWFLDKRDVQRRRRYRERELEEEARDAENAREIAAREERVEEGSAGEQTGVHTTATTTQREEAHTETHPQKLAEGEPLRRSPMDDAPKESVPPAEVSPASKAAPVDVYVPAHVPVPAPAPPAPAHKPPAPTKLKTQLKTKISGKRKLDKLAKSSFAFAEEEEETVRGVERKLVPIEYTAEELAAAKRPATHHMAEDEKEEQEKQSVAVAAKAAALAAAAVTAKKRKTTAPSSDAEVLAFAVDWDTYTNYTTIFKKINTWVTGKVKSLLGGDEPSLVEFIIQKLRDAKPRATDLITDLESMLEDEAEPFVVELWRVLIEETKRK